MYPFWKSNLGKLIAGGCGIQIGMLATFGALAVILLFCSLCTLANVMSIGLTQELAGLSDRPPVEASPSTEDVVSLLDEVDSLLGQVELLQTNAPVTGPATPPGNPRVVANQSPVDLYSGPGFDYKKVGLLPAGESLEIVGRNNGSTWWLVSGSAGLFAWAPDVLVTALDINDAIPVVVASSQLAQPAASGPALSASPTPPPTATVIPTPTLPPGTPTPDAAASRQYVADLPSYQKVKASLLVPPVSASISPDGRLIAMTERIKMYTFTTEGAHTDIWLEDNDKLGPLGGAVWSPDGKYLAFVVGYKPKCQPCRSVALINMSDRSMTFLTAPNGLDTDMPRWTQDGRLLINVHPDEPADGVAYVYDVYGYGQEAAGVYVLSASHEGQKWFPWRPGRIWRAGVTERADSYNSD